MFCLVDAAGSASLFNEAAYNYLVALGCYAYREGNHHAGCIEQVGPPKTDNPI